MCWLQTHDLNLRLVNEDDATPERNRVEIPGGYRRLATRVWQEFGTAS